MAAIASLDRKCTLMILHRPSAVWLQGTAAFCLEFFASSFFLLQLFAASTMTYYWADLPSGWRWSTKEVVVWEWRCPFGDVCGKGDNVLYTKSTRDEAKLVGGFHLFDMHKQPAHRYTVMMAVLGSEAGLTKCTKEECIIVDDSGREISPPTRLRRRNKGKGKGKSDAVDYGGGRERSRSRDRRLH